MESVSSKGGFYGKRVIQGRVLWKACHPGAGSMERANPVAG